METMAHKRLKHDSSDEHCAQGNCNATKQEVDDEFARKEVRANLVASSPAANAAEGYFASIVSGNQWAGASPSQYQTLRLTYNPYDCPNRQIPYCASRQAPPFNGYISQGFPTSLYMAPGGSFGNVNYPQAPPMYNYVHSQGNMPDRMQYSHMNNVMNTSSSTDSSIDDSAWRQQNSFTSSPCPLTITPPSTPEEIFCKVAGRLALLGSSDKYVVTVSEVQRRLNLPEGLNTSLLGGIFRRAKQKNGGEQLRKELLQFGISLSAGRRKQSHVTLFTSLVEAEALHLAQDFRLLCYNDFPTKELAKHVNGNSVNWARKHNNNQTTTMAINKRKEQVKSAQQILGELSSAIKCHDPSTRCQDEPSINFNHQFDQNVQAHLSDFSALTHSFGGPAIMAVLGLVQTYLSDSETYLTQQLMNLNAKPEWPNSSPESIGSPQMLAPIENVILNDKA